MKKGDRDGWRKQEGERGYGEGERGLCRYIIEEIEQQEGERRQELAEKAVTRVLLMCNETLHRGKRQPEGQTDGGRQG